MHVLYVYVSFWKVAKISDAGKYFKESSAQLDFDATLAWRVRNMDKHSI